MGSRGWYRVLRRSCHQSHTQSHPKTMLIDSSNEPELLKYVLCERMADFYGLPVDYIYAEFVDPEKATLEEVEFVLSRM